MNPNKRISIRSVLRRRVLASVLVSACLVIAGPARAEVGEVRIALGFGIGFLPLTYMKSKGLMEKYARELGLGDVKVTWYKFTGGSTMNDALLAGTLDFGSGGVPPFITLWSRTQGADQVKIAAVMSQMPLFLNTNNPAVKSIKDLTEKDKIAVPGVKTSNQAVLLAMAASEQLGADQVERINRLTTSMSHPDGLTALMNGLITGHFTSPPFQYLELKDPKIHTILTSKEVMGGPFTFTVVWATSKFRNANPRIYEAFVNAMTDAIDSINRDKRAAAEFYLQESKSNESVESVLAMLNDPDIEFTHTPRSTKKYAEFVHKLGLIKIKPSDWKQLFFQNVHKYPGS